ncbi:MAG TPA: hypothetical protein VHK24_13900 [Steroidobacter sp.]|jgi:putative tryptophan/tyrosine transport system substrate-binding protein|nr:hypothetical protein [Steroidobacter sp.]
MKRREFIAVLGGAGAACPLAARAQQLGRVPIISFLDRTARFEWTAAFVQRELGWTENRTVATEYRCAEGRAERFPL